MEIDLRIRPRIQEEFKKSNKGRRIQELVIKVMGVARISFRWGNILGDLRRGGPEDKAQRTPENFRKYAKIFLRKVQKALF